MQLQSDAVQHAVCVTWVHLYGTWVRCLYIYPMISQSRPPAHSIITTALTLFLILLIYWLYIYHIVPFSLDRSSVDLYLYVYYRIERCLVLETYFLQEFVLTLNFRSYLYSHLSAHH